MSVHWMGTAGAAKEIVCFSRIDEELYDFVQELSRNKDGCVLAIPTANTAIDTSLMWQLLHAGASDVLVWSSGADLGERIRARLERWRAVDDLVNSPPVQAKLVRREPALAQGSSSDHRGGAVRLRLPFVSSSKRNG